MLKNSPFPPNFGHTIADGVGVGFLRKRFFDYSSSKNKKYPVMTKLAQNCPK
jgi:hypothetical protein